jgi:hypothetical protein
MSVTPTITPSMSGHRRRRGAVVDLGSAGALGTEGWSSDADLDSSVGIEAIDLRLRCSPKRARIDAIRIELEHFVIERTRVHCCFIQAIQCFKLNLAQLATVCRRSLGRTNTVFLELTMPFRHNGMLQWRRLGRPPSQATARPRCQDCVTQRVAATTCPS